MIIEVTQLDISKGSLCRSTDCPVALAVNRVLTPEYYSIVTMWSITIVPRTDMALKAGWKAICPGIAQSFVREFDKQNEVVPFNFELNIPEEYLRK